MVIYLHHPNQKKTWQLHLTNLGIQNWNQYRQYLSSICFLASTAWPEKQPKESANEWHHLAIAASNARHRPTFVDELPRDHEPLKDYSIHIRAEREREGTCHTLCIRICKHIYTQYTYMDIDMDIEQKHVHCIAWIALMFMYANTNRSWTRQFGFFIDKDVPIYQCDVNLYILKCCIFLISSNGIIRKGSSEET